MKDPCMVYHEEKQLSTRSKSEWDALVDAHLDYDDVLRESGQFIIGQALLPVETATTLRVRDGKASITDAIRVATKIPSARLGSLEVRPARELTHS